MKHFNWGIFKFLLEWWWLRSPTSKFYIFLGQQCFNTEFTYPLNAKNFQICSETFSNISFEEIYILFFWNIWNSLLFFLTFLFQFTVYDYGISIKQDFFSELLNFLAIFFIYKICYCTIHRLPDQELLTFFMSRICVTKAAIANLIEMFLYKYKY